MKETIRRLSDSIEKHARQLNNFYRVIGLAIMGFAGLQLPREPIEWGPFESFVFCFCIFGIGAMMFWLGQTDSLRVNIQTEFEVIRSELKELKEVKKNG